MPRGYGGSKDLRSFVLASTSGERAGISNIQQGMANVEGTLLGSQLRHSLFDIPRNGDERETPRMPGALGRNKLAQFRHRGSAFAVGLPELRKLVPAYMFRPIINAPGRRTP